MMTDKLPSPWRLNPTRVFLIAVVVAALGLAALTIVASLNGWQAEDAKATAAP